jgi:hypothetical protein
LLLSAVLPGVAVDHASCGQRRLGDAAEFGASIGSLFPVGLEESSDIGIEHSPSGVGGIFQKTSPSRIPLTLFALSALGGHQ